MTSQRQLNREISAVTGESVREIARRGFVPLSCIPVERDPEDLIVDWDLLDLDRNVPLFLQSGLRTESKGGVAACY